MDKNEGPGLKNSRGFLFVILLTLFCKDNLSKIQPNYKTKKMKKLFLVLLAATGFFALSCSKTDIENDPGTGPGEPGGSDKTGSISVTIASESPSSRAIGNPSTDDENTVHSFSVYVFNNATGVLEAEKTFSGSLTGRMDGLGVASQKKVVVLVNRPDGFPTIAAYNDFTGASALVSLGTQVPGDFQSEGLFMSGETSAPVTLSADNVVKVPVTVSRLTSKIRLGSLTVTPDQGLSIDDFVLEGVSIQKARDHYNAMGIDLSTGFDYIGGVQLPGFESLQADYLNELYSLPGGYAGTKLDPQVYFYVFPNDNTDGNATLMNLYGQYKGTDVFFPFYINDQVGSNGSTTDGTWIGRNKVYTLNVTLRKIGNGGGDPNVPNEQVSMDVEIDVADWEGELIQEIEW